MNGLKICFDNKFILGFFRKAVLASLCVILFVSLHSDISAVEIIDGHLVRSEAVSDTESDEEEKNSEETKEEDADEKDDGKNKDEEASYPDEDAKNTDEADFDENGVREIVLDDMVLYAKMSNNNLREKPVTDAEILDLVPRGIELEVMSVWETKEGNIWYKLQYGDKIGYVWGDAVKVRSEAIQTEKEEEDTGSAADMDNASGKTNDRIDFLPYSTTFDPAYEKYLADKEKAGNGKVSGEISETGENDLNGMGNSAASQKVTSPTFSESFQRSMSPFLITLLAAAGASFILFLVFFINFLVQSRKLKKRKGDGYH